jgi:hypothetical protein
MAYPTVSAPSGFKPINRVDGNVYAGATRQYAIDPAESIFFGDLVKIVAGVVLPFVPGTDENPAGVFVGAQYTNSMSQTIQGQYYPAGSANGVAYVVVDPQAAYQVAVTTSGEVVDSTTIAAIGANMQAAVTSPSGDVNSGNSTMSLAAGSEGAGATSTTLPVKVIDVVPATKTATGYPELIVKINVTQFDSAAGV